MTQNGSYMTHFHHTVYDYLTVYDSPYMSITVYDSIYDPSSRCDDVVDKHVFLYSTYVLTLNI